MKYDDASWHYGGDFPRDLPPSAGATHIAMFVTWALLNGLAGELHVIEFPDELAALRARAVSPTTWFLSNCDGKFTDEDLDGEGNRFALAYYADGDGMHTKPASYLDDYQRAFIDLASLYFVPDTWETFERLAPIVRSRFEHWQAARG